MKKKTIDVQDIEILNILAEHAELNNKELSARIGLSEGPTLVRMQNLWGRDIIKSYSAEINFHLFGYSKFHLIRAEVTDTDAHELKNRLSHSRYLVTLVELEGTNDIVMRIYLCIFQTKNLKAAKDELQRLTAGIKGLHSVTFNQISSFVQKTLQLDEKDVIK
jgi:DNA-binding Lrp family transcriptional regulator